MLIAQGKIGYFDLTKHDASEIRLMEKYDKTNCVIESVDESGIKYKGFKLTDNPKINICCDVAFYTSSITSKYLPRLTFIKVDKEFKIKEQEGKDKVRIDLNDSKTAENFWKIIGFLFEFKTLVDVDAFNKNYSVVDSSAYIIEFETKEQSEKINALRELVDKVNLSDVEIEIILRENRKRNLQHFERLLTEKESWKIYFEKYKDEIKGKGEEAVWHHFLKKHHWFLGLNIDIKFIRDLITEGEVGIPNTDGRGSPFVDFLGISDYTTLVELKTSNTKIFTDTRKNTSRTNTWSFSSDFIDGISQCLGQKFDWDKKSESKNIVSGTQMINQTKHRTLDPKVIFIIGNKQEEFSEDSTDVLTVIKRDTFERFRRNSRNVEIVTFDELYERANYIVNNQIVNDEKFSILTN